MDTRNPWCWDRSTLDPQEFHLRVLPTPRGSLLTPSVSDHKDFTEGTPLVPIDWETPQSPNKKLRQLESALPRLTRLGLTNVRQTKHFRSKPTRPIPVERAPASSSLSPPKISPRIPPTAWDRWRLGKRRQKARKARGRTPDEASGGSTAGETGGGRRKCSKFKYFSKRSTACHEAFVIHAGDPACLPDQERPPGMGASLNLEPSGMRDADSQCDNFRGRGSVEARNIYCGIHRSRSQL